MIDRQDLEIAVVPGDEVVAHQLAVLDQGIGGRQKGLVLLVGPQPFDLVGKFPLLDRLVRRDEETVLVHAGINRQAGNEADVRAFGGFDRANPPVVGNVYVADFESGPLAVQAARSEGAAPCARG